MMKRIFFLTTLLLISCGHSVKKDESNIVKTTEEIPSQADSKIDNALTFINKYVDNCNDLKRAIDMVDWVNSSTLVTKSFKTELIRMMDEAYKKEPKVGLDFDPILDAQDWPEKGFELDSSDKETGYLTIKGKDWPEFKLTMRMVQEKRIWLVDGCGVINIPNEKRFEK